MANSVNASGGPGMTGLLAVAFIVLKLCHVINWPWVWVLAPIWISALLLLVLVAILIIVLIARGR